MLPSRHSPSCARPWRGSFRENGGNALVTQVVDGDLDRINIIATAYGTVGDLHLRQTSKTVKWWNGRRASSTGQILDRPMTTWMICKTSIAILLSGALQFVPTGDAFAG